MSNDLVAPGADSAEADSAVGAEALPPPVDVPPSLVTAEQAAEAAPAALVTAAPDGAAAEAAPAEPALPSFDDLGLHPDIRAALDDMGYFRPTAVQATVFKPVSEGKDLLVQSRTGTGKTTAFGLPLLNRLVPAEATPQALILAPTRELALQVTRELSAISKHRGLVVETLYGGAPIGKQINALKKGVHVVVGTPGRVLDHIGRRTLDTRAISTFVLDECDEMLSMGFLEDIERVVSHLPEKRQTLLFSATMPDEVQRYSRRHMKAPEQIKLSSGNISVAEIHHAYYVISGIGRARDLLKLLLSENPESAIIFCNQRDETNAVAKFLQKQGLDAEALSSDLSQSDRERVMGRMKAHNLRFLVATDVAARGIDISNLSHVINYSFPDSAENYVHRTGRTGRAGKRGVALSLIGPRDLGAFWMLRLTYKLKPEERDLPPDSIFEGKLKHPLPPLGAPKPPDPVAILVRGVTGTASDLERGIFEKLLANPQGRRVLAKLVADRLNELTTKTKPRPERGERSQTSEQREGGEERTERGDRGDRFERGDRPERGDRFGGREERGERGDRFGSREGREGGGFRRERGDGEGFRGRDRGEGFRAREDRGEGFRAREDRGERSERPERSDRPAGERSEGFRAREDRGDRPAGEGFRAREDRPNREDRGDRGDRPHREDRGEGFRRDRGDRPNREERGEGFRAREDRGDRPARDERGDRPNGDRPSGERPNGERTERGDRPSGERTNGERPSGERTERGEGFRARDERGDRPNRDERGDRPNGDRGDRPNGDRGDFRRDRNERGERPNRDEARPDGEQRTERPNRDERGDFRRDRDRNRRDERPEAAAAPAAVTEPAAAPAAEAAAPTSTVPPVAAHAEPQMATVSGDSQGLRADAPTSSEHRRDRGPRGDRDRDRDRGPRPDRRDDKREEKRDDKREAAPQAAAAAPAAEPAKRGGTQEFWETWADQKAARPAPAPAAAPAPAPAAAEPAAEASDEDGGSKRRRGGKDRGRDKKSDAKPEAKTDAKTEAKSEPKADKAEPKADKAEKPEPRSKKSEPKAEAKSEPADSGEQVRLHVSLGKKHGVTADSLRALLGGSDKTKIGSVMLRDTHAHVRVSSSLAKQIIAKHNGTSYEGNDVTVELAH